jgi:GAF domain-containing protein
LLEQLRRVRPADADGGEDADGQLERIQRDLDTAEIDLTEVSERLVEAENQRSRLMNLYVASYQLHATVDLEEVISTIAEILRELLGAEKYVLLLTDEERGGCDIALRSGLDEGDELFAGERYTGGDATVDEALEDGLVKMEPAVSSSVLAAVPLRVQGANVGAVAVLKLFDHKAAFTAGDRDLLDLMAAHAASALLAARMYSATDRKLKTLENLVKLVR